MTNKEFDTAYKQSVHIKPAVGGMLQKSHPQSYFLKVGTHSKTSEHLFKHASYINEEGNNVEVSILQVAFLSDSLFCEVVNKQDIVNSYVSNKSEAKIGF